MERVDWEGEVSERKATYTEGIERYNARCLDSEDNPTYRKCREGWNKFIRGELTHKQLEEYIGVNESSGTKEIKELFEAEDKWNT